MTINYNFYSLGAFDWLFSQVSHIFQLQRPIWRFVSKVSMFHFGPGLLVHFHLVDWKTHFSILQGLLQISNNFCRFCWFFLQTFDVFQLPGPIWGFLSDAGMFHFGRSLLVRFNLLDWTTHFSILQGLFKCFNIFLDLVGFLCRLLMFPNCQDRIGDFWVMAVCLNFGGVFWYTSIWKIGRPTFQYCRGLL